MDSVRPENQVDVRRLLHGDIDPHAICDEVKIRTRSQ